MPEQTKPEDASLWLAATTGKMGANKICTQTDPSGSSGLGSAAVVVSRGDATGLVFQRIFLGAHEKTRCARAGAPCLQDQETDQVSWTYR